MPQRIQLRIITPRRQVLDETVSEVTAPGTLGEFGVLADHAAFLSSLEIGRLTYKVTGGVKHLAVRGGFAEVANNILTVLADDAACAEEVNASQAESDQREAQAAMKGLSPLDPAYRQADADRRWAEARLAVARAR